MSPDLAKKFHVYVDWITINGVSHIIYVGKGNFACRQEKTTRDGSR